MHYRAPPDAVVTLLDLALSAAVVGALVLSLLRGGGHA
jgi:hypothetical protein